MSVGPRVWVNGNRYNRVYLLDMATGSAKKFTLRRKTNEIDQTAGNGERFGSAFVAVYVHPFDLSLVIQIGTSVYPVDGLTRVSTAQHLVGTYATLTIERPGMRTRTIRQRTIARAVLRVVDPTYDSLDESLDDFSADIVDVVCSPERQQLMLETKDPSAGPWDVLK
ncbi:hypothetical protein GCM10022234_15720 [Aeromicrobium panaciterrae]|uniref:hypothetical protein n=1 Tax=Aeromicrobium panaciterrae TaxID=363861 RepID=UPI0031DE0FAE